MWLKYMSNTKQERHSRQNGNNNNDNNNNNNNKTIFLPIYAKYHKWAIQDLHQQWKEIGTRWKQNTELSKSKQDPSHLEHSNNVYVPLLIDSSDIKGTKTIPAKQRLYKQTIKTFWWTTGKPNHHHGPSWINTNQGRQKSSGCQYMKTKKSTIKTRHACRNTKSSSITSQKRHIVR